MTRPESLERDTTTTPPVSAGSRAVGAGLAALGGLALAVQGRINGQLGARLHDGTAAALVSFGVGLVVLAIAVPATPGGRRGLAALRSELRGRRLAWWQTLGGTCGAFFVASQGITIAALGVAVFRVAAVAGQVVSSLVVDRLGLGPAGRQPLTAPRVLGAALAVVAVAVSVSTRFDAPGGLWLAALPALGGILIGWQQAVNGLVRRAADHTGVAALVNFGVGFCALLVVCAVDVALRGWPAAAPHTWWLYVGGVLGIVAIGTAAGSVRFIGVLLVGLCSVAGQLVGALLLDLVAPAAGAHLALSSVVGTALTLVAAGVAALRRRTR